MGINSKIPILMCDNGDISIPTDFISRINNNAFSGRNNVRTYARRNIHTFMFSSPTGTEV